MTTRGMFGRHIAVLILAIPCAGLLGCQPDPGPGGPPPATPPAERQIDKSQFEKIDKTQSELEKPVALTVTPAAVHFKLLPPEEVGVNFTYYGNPSPEHFMTEQNGGGAAVCDFDGDGLPDLFLVNGSNAEHPAEPATDSHRLYLNRGTETGPLRFQDVSRESRLNVAGFGMGAVAGDYDNDGFCDLFICYYGQDQLWHNNGDGTFDNVTEAATIGDPEWSASAAFADLDADGDLDLYVTNYVVYTANDPPCFSQHQTPVKISCGPIGRTAQVDRLWENLGDGRFADASERSGIHSVAAGKGLAVEIVDLDGDDQLDIYVANDTTDNFLFQNAGGLQFSEIGRQAGVAVSADGTPGSSMGIACADFDGNQRPDLFVTNFENSANDYYDNQFETTFLHRSSALGLDSPSRPMLAFGTVAADFELDGWPDIFVANGHIWDLRALQFGHLYEMPPQLFHNSLGRRFQDVSASAGTYFNQQWLGRSAATGDLDRDGDADLVVTHELQPAAILQNDSARRGQSSIVRLIGTTATRQPLGLKVTYVSRGVTRVAHVTAGGSFQASHEPMAILTCGSAETIDSVTVHWKAGQREVWKQLPVGCDIQLVEGRAGFSVKPLRTPAP